MQEIPARKFLVFVCHRGAHTTSCIYDGEFHNCVEECFGKIPFEERKCHKMDCLLSLNYTCECGGNYHGDA